MLFISSCDTFDMYIRKALEGVNLYELSVFGESLGRDIKVVELRGFDVNNFRNDRVSYYINKYQGSWKPYMQKIIDRSQIYLPYIKEVFKEKGVPEDLVYLPIIESDFNTQAVSHAGAAGLWQFMPMTGAIYNLKVNYWSDDRFDPERSTKAAADHLVRLDKNFKSWVIALIAYNAGGGRISRAIQEVKSNDFEDLLKAGVLPKETEEYIPKYVASVIIAKNPEKFGFVINKPNVVFPQGDLVYVDDAADLSVIAKMMDIDTEDIKALNPHLARGVTPPGMIRYPIRVPKGMGSKFNETFAKIPASERVTFRRHEVKMNETLSHLSKFYNVPVNAIADINKLKSRELNIGQQVMIPIQGLDNAKQIDLAQYEGEQQRIREGKFVYFESLPPPDYEYRDIMYHIRAGDTLWVIARKFNIDIAEIKAWNKLNSNVLSIGTEIFLRIPINK
ncbi:LysM peptidoglycan-binding domain-containing protein [uncultured Brachyspira sp.]|uniref:LysM peptidoglycan-binding domain-containing protein n=1 Tax=uncultured Brachyspira sp. TaxID=221953 RepID=UPI0025E0DD66|nr:LysM peptidoglycan-binding domain-containing protein [uncultured Brachyspira sp.]